MNPLRRPDGLLPTTGFGVTNVTHGTEVYPAPALWYAIRTRSRAEQAVANRLALQEIDTFLPRYFEPVVWSDRINQTPRVLFPGYLFARLAGLDQLKLAARIAGVIQILGSTAPEPVDAAQIESIRIACESGQTIQPVCSPQKGQIVVIKSGPFAGAEGVIDSLNKNRLILKVDLLGRGVSVTIDRKTRIEPKR